MSSSGQSRRRGSYRPRREILQADVRDGPTQYLRATSEFALGMGVAWETRTQRWTPIQSTKVDHGDVSSAS